MERGSPARVQSSPEIKFDNPPPPLFARGDERKVDLYGAISAVICRDVDHFSVFDPFEDRREKGIFEDDPEAAAGDQIKDFEFVEMRMDAEDPQTLKSRLLEVFGFLRKRKYVFLGLLELEANAFERSVHLEIDQKVVNKLVAIHRHFRDETKFPTVERGFLRNRVKVRFLSEVLQEFYPAKKDWTLGDFANHLYSRRGFIAGIVVAAGGVAEFHVLASSLRHVAKLEGPTRIHWGTLKQLLESITKREKVPVSWFRLDVGLAALELLHAYGEIREDAELKAAIEQHSEYLGELLRRKFRSLPTDDGKELDLSKVTGAEREKIVKELEETIGELDRMLEETEKRRDPPPDA
ncbi:MAG: hypothetical protein Kow0069_08310 [Promethearchaeota archaeon]